MTLAGAEGIDLDLHLAGVGSRGIAFLVDLTLQSLVLFLVTVTASAFDELGVAAAAIATFVILLGYPILAEGLAGGRTVGKALLRIRVVAADGTPVTFLQAVIRNLVRVVDALPGVYGVGIASVLVTGRAQRVGDLAAGTVVVHQGPAGVARAPSPSAAVDLPDDADSWDLAAVTADELAAVRSFLARRADLAPEHRADLAQSLSFQLLPKVAGVPLDGGPEAFLERVEAAKTRR